MDTYGNWVIGFWGSRFLGQTRPEVVGDIWGQLESSTCWFPMKYSKCLHTWYTYDVHRIHLHMIYIISRQLNLYEFIHRYIRIYIYTYIYIYVYIYIDRYHNFSHWISLQLESQFDGVRCPQGQQYDLEINSQNLMEEERSGNADHRDLKPK